MKKATRKSQIPAEGCNVRSGYDACKGLWKISVISQIFRHPQMEA